MSVGFLGLGGTGNAMAAVGLHQIDLHSAAKMDDTIAVVRLLKEGFNVDKRDPYGYTPLHWACQKGHTHTVQALLAAGANVHVRDKWRRTPLHRAAKEGHKPVAAALLDSGAEINAQGDNNWTPLHCSSFHGKLEIVEMLLSHGADQGAKDVRGRTSAAVCDMGLYDVEQGVKDKILHLLESPPRQLQLEPPRAAPMLVLPPPNTPITPDAIPAAIGTATLALPASGAADGATASSAATAAAATAAAATAAAAAASAAAAATPSGGTKSAGLLQSGDAHSASRAVVSAASAALAAETGVFALWDTSLSAGGINAGGVMEADWTDSEDVAWQEMWSMLHVPDPDDPDNNLYSEVKTLRKDVKRLRSDLNDTSSYEGVISNSVGPPGVGATSGGDGDDSADSAGSATAEGSKHDRDEEESAAAKRSAERTSPDGELPIELPPGKRQKSEEIGGGGGEARAAAVANGMACLVKPPGTGGDAAGGGGGGGSAEDKEEIARMGEIQLREQLEIQGRLVTEMMKEIALLKGHAGGALDAPAGAASALPVLEDRSFANRVR